VDDVASFDVLCDRRLRERLRFENVDLFVTSLTSGARNTLKPLLSKSSGMGPLCNWYFLPLVQEHIVANPRLAAVFAALYACEAAQLAVQPERLGLKARGAGDMARHCDAPLFPERCDGPSPSDMFRLPTRFRDRIQAIVVLDIDESGAARDSGTLELLPHFHAFRAVARIYAHPTTGFRPLSADAARGCITPFDAFDVEQFNGYLQAWRRLQTLSREQLSVQTFAQASADEHARRALLDTLAATPSTPPLSLRVPLEPRALAWQAVRAPRGALLLWDSLLPHRNLRNKSRRIRAVAYVDCRRVEQLQATSTGAARRAAALACAPFGQGSNRCNTLETRWRAAHAGDVDEIRYQSLAQWKMLVLGEIDDNDNNNNNNDNNNNNNNNNNKRSICNDDDDE
jgi:hypothetical protein